MKTRSMMNMLSVSGGALFLSLLLLSSGSANAQAKPEGARGKLPLLSAMSEIIFLDDAKKSLVRAQQFEAQQAGFDAVQEYEGLLDRSRELPGQLSHSYEFYVVLAGAHLDAARTRMTYATSFDKNLVLFEQNQTQIGKHLKAVPGLVTAAAEAAGGSPALERFRCNAFKLLAYGQFLRGLQNHSSKDLTGAVGAYEKVATCDPTSEKQTKNMISYTKSVEREVSKSFWRADNVAKVVSNFVSISVPKVGSYLSVALDHGYEHYKETRKAPIPPPMR